MFPVFNHGSNAQLANHISNLISLFSIPNYPIVTYNVRSLSSYVKGKAWISRRRKRIISNIISLSKNNDIIHLQETKLLPGEELSLAVPAISGWARFFNSKSERSGGCVTLVSPRLQKLFNITQISTGSSLVGHALPLLFAPKAPGLHGFLDINVYLYAGSEQHKKAQMLDELKKIKPHTYTFVSGDFNLIETREDTSSDTDYHVMGPRLFDAWQDFLTHFNLSEVTQSTHTYYHITRDLKKSRTTRLDRHYTSLSEVDLAVTIPDASIAAVPHSILNIFGLVTAEELHDMQESKEKVELMKISSASDHIPVRLSFRENYSDNKKKKRIPVWLAKDPRFNKIFGELWTDREESIEDEDAYENLVDFKIALHEASEALLASLREQRAQPADDLGKFSIAATLLRLTDRTFPDKKKIRHYLFRYPSYNNLISYTDGLYNNDKLRAYMAELLTKGSIEGSMLEEDPLQVHGAKSGDNVVDQIKLLLPSTRKRVAGLRTTLDEEMTTTPTEMGKIAKDYWEQIWSKDAATSSPSTFLGNYSKRGNDLKRPSIPDVQEVERIINSTNNSCAGPDGIPFAAYRTVSTYYAPIAHATLLALSRGEPPPVTITACCS